MKKSAVHRPRWSSLSEGGVEVGVRLQQLAPLTPLISQHNRSQVSGFRSRRAQTSDRVADAL